MILSLILSIFAVWFSIMVFISLVRNQARRISHAIRSINYTENTNGVETVLALIAGTLWVLAYYL